MLFDFKVVHLAEHVHQRQTVWEVEEEPAASHGDCQQEISMLMQSESDDEEEEEHDGDSAHKL